MAAVLELLVETTSVPRNAAAIGEASRRRGEAPGDWRTDLVAALPPVGLRGAIVEGAGRDTLSSAGRGQPVVVAGTIDGARRALVVTDRRGSKVRLADPTSGRAWWVRTPRLEAIVGSAEHTECVAVDASMPLDPIGPAASAHAQGDHPTPLERLAAWMRLDRQDLLAIVVYAIAIGLLALTTPIAVQALVSTVAFGTVVQPLVMLSLALFAALGLSAVFRGLQAWLVEVLQRRLFARVVTDLAHRLPRVRRDALDGVHGPELVNRFFDVFTVQKTASALLLGGLEVVLTVAVGLVVLAFYHPFLLALDVVLVSVIAAVILVRARAGARTAVDESKAKYAMAAWLQELALHHAELKLSGGQSHATERAHELARAYLETRARHFRIAFQQLVSMLAVQAVASAAVLGVGGWLVIERQLTLGQLVAAEIVVTAVVASLAKVGKHLENLYDLLAGLDKLGHLADLPVEREGGSTFEVAGRAELRLERLRGGYLDGEVLTGVDLRVEPGERVVITGPSGGGKSLLVEWIAGIREPAGGRLEIDGRDVRDLSLGSLRSRIAAVMRTATLAGTVLENVRLGRSSIGRAEVRAALSQVGVLEDVEALPGGLDARLLPDGAPLSDGQALRLTLARAIAARPGLLIVDHVLDGMDDTTRAPVLDALFDEAAPWTLVVVSSDPNVKARADRVVVLDEGVLREGESR